jgi:hypothetical protein
MTTTADHPRQLRRFGHAAVVIAGVLLALTALGRRPPTEPQPRPDTRRGLDTRRPLPQPPHAHDRPARWRASAPSPRREIIAVARRFATAYFDYQDGRSGRRVREALRASATPGLGTALLGAPVRVPAGRRPRRSRLTALHILKITPTAAYVLTTLRHRGHRRQLVITLRRRGRSFTAAAVR